MRHRPLFRLALVATTFGVGHHVDHVIRGNHVGWPLIPEVTPFTYSLGFYPVIALGLWLHARGRVEPGFWSALAGAGALFVGLLHFGPWAVEPPAHVIGPYRSPIAGYVALAWLVCFVGVLAGTSLCAGRLWLRDRGGSRAARAVVA